MRCKKHSTDPSGAIGVCATCLRHRLLSLIDSQSQPLPLPPPPPPPSFPRSVSPYISRRKSDADLTSDDHRNDRFFSTPQVGPTGTKKKSKFNLFSSLFRSRSAKPRHASDPFSDRRNSIPRLSSLDETSSTFDGRRNSEIGCSPEPWRRTPGSVNRPSPARSQLASGFGLCLSPLVRPGPARHWKGKAAGGTESGYSGEMKAHLASAASLPANRSRKIADFGRFNSNR